jgi:putative ABC transport system substrate-binding protein
MKAKILVYALPALILATIHLAEAQQQTKVNKIGWLNAASGRLSQFFDGYKKELRGLGYIEGKNIAFEYRSAEGETGRFPALADELVRLKVDLIVANATTAALAAKNATRTIPIVFTSSGDPVAVGLIDSLARPGGNLTGFSNMTSELAGKRLELLKETVPKLSRVAVLRDPRNVASMEDWKESLHPARELKSAALFHGS